jgi:hypothetical protein
LLLLLLKYIFEEFGSNQTPVLSKLMMQGVGFFISQLEGINGEILIQVSA